MIERQTNQVYINKFAYSKHWVVLMIRTHEQFSVYRVCQCNDSLFIKKERKENEKNNILLQYIDTSSISLTHILYLYIWISLLL